MNKVTSALIRGMANVLVDHDIDPYDMTASVGALIIAGFDIQDINEHYKDATTMATMRISNERRKAR